MRSFLLLVLLVALFAFASAQSSSSSSTGDNDGSSSSSSAANVVSSSSGATSSSSGSVVSSSGAGASSSSSTAGGNTGVEFSIITYLTSTDCTGQSTTATLTGCAASLSGSTVQYWQGASCSNENGVTYNAFSNAQCTGTATPTTVPSGCQPYTLPGTSTQVSRKFVCGSGENTGSASTVAGSAALVAALAMLAL